MRKWEMSLKKRKLDNYCRIDNDLYDRDGDIWRQSDSPFFLMQCSVNPARLSYLKKKLFTEFDINPQGRSALEVGCGGGVLTREIALMGFDVIGIDPSEQSIKIATEHAYEDSLRITYEKGMGEALPYRNGAFDVVFCCDVLEHVRDVPKVISEISRVLKPGGLFCYDTLNRTLLSKLLAIHISQDWKRWAFAPPNLHVWEMFIKPDELKNLLGQNNLEWKEHVGMGPNVSLLKLLRLLRKRAAGLMTYKDIGRYLFMVESRSMNIMYMGYAIKTDIQKN